MKIHTNKNNALFLIIFSTSFPALSSQIDPDSVGINSGLNINVSHNINGKSVEENPLVNITYGDWGAWETSSYMIDCTPWTPAASTVDWGKEFIQITYCSADETREREVTYHYADGTTYIEIESQTERNQVEDEQDAVGTKNFILYESKSEGNWIPDGNKYACGFYLPYASTVTQGTVFQQTQKCLHDYYRTVYTYLHWADGDRTIKKTETETKTQHYYSYRSSTGTMKKDLRWVEIKRGSTFRSGNCGLWEPRLDGKTCNAEGVTKEIIAITSGNTTCAYQYTTYQCRAR